MFLAAGLGAFMLSRSATFDDFLAFGLTQLALGAAALASFYLARAAAPPSDWEIPPDPSAWILGCVLVMGMGLSGVAAAWNEGRRGAPPLQPSAPAAISG
jgi:hypothetical protein